MGSCPPTPTRNGVNTSISKSDLPEVRARVIASRVACVGVARARGAHTRIARARARAANVLAAPARVAHVRVPLKYEISNLKSALVLLPSARQAVASTATYP